MYRRCFTIIILHVFYLQAFSQGIIRGKVTGKEGPLPYVNVGVKGYNIGTFTDENGFFEISDIPNGLQSIVFSCIGFQSIEKQININGRLEADLNIAMERSFEQLEEVVISGSRTEQKRSEAAVVVGIIDQKSLETVQANTLAEGLNFQAGLRMETDCQTCGYSQLRMNGLGGAYSMILIDSRPIFSPLMGLYGLEMMPTNLVERIEVVRGGGSALYGSSAIAGTVNVITKEPTRDYLNINAYGGVIDHQSYESNLNASLSKVFDKAGITLQISRNDREPYDANGDGFSELPKLEGLNFGLNTFYKVGKYSTLAFNVNGINEYRRGGNKIEEPAHKSDQSEERDHNILMGGLNFKTSMPGIKSSASIYLSGQNTKRKHYTGIDQADAYGNTLGQTIMGGFQYNYLPRFHTITLGAEYLFDYVNDEIPLYKYLIDQETNQLGFFIQNNWKISTKFTLLAGLRLDRHNMVNRPILNPRMSLLYNLFDFTQLRASYSTGYRAPQAFDADLHIAFAGGGVSIIRLDPELKEETSESYSLSFSYDRPSEKYIYGFTLDVFHTRLEDAFILEDNGLDDQGNMILLKQNGSGSTVQGLTIEGRTNYNNYLELDLGFTFQKSYYDEPVQWSSELEGTTEYLRTPQEYGYYTLDVNPNDRFTVSLNGTYTGKMLVPHFGGAPGVPDDRIVNSKTFFDQGLKISYEIPVRAIKQGIQFFGGVKNIFNAYQSDFDIGRYRDSNFVYGPARPRTIFVGIRLQTL
ncbi:MAG: TonB-dependent receptor [Cytophagales bacterium]|nr:TonB-dependent receptor [Cytophagales bacterium]